MLQEDDYDSDTSDDDFVPQGVESDEEPVSGEEDEGDEAEDDCDASVNDKGKKKKKLKKGKVVVEKEQEKDKPKNEEKEKKKADDIWADFLADVEEKPTPPPKPNDSSWAAVMGHKKSPSSSNALSKPEASSAKSEKKDKEDGGKKSNTVKITQVFEFAGEEVRVEKEVEADSVEAKAALISPPETSTASEAKSPSGLQGKKRPVGLSSIVGLLDNKKQKLTTLEKTKLDWNSFKTHEGIDEDLEQHKKSKHGYLDKQAFLERADLRQFEIERTMRMKKRSNR
ncbi:craniofacial development protein 1-like [Homarus americanus]|uniref:craniofacial development protein 1-like n=1 Tax=Homarus americanus TaxID=6706 RepID=UPI001C47FC5C|nr:craniofacial development protein 1-like [Homarus americanus]